MTVDYSLHTLGWKSFQDLCLAIAEDCLKRPVQSFLSSQDGGRDGAFVGKWDEGPDAGSSVIQCKFTSIERKRLNLSLLEDELSKVKKLTESGLLEDYIILTNHYISGREEGKIKREFCVVGAKNCRVFGGDWIVRQIEQSSRLRMLVPRLYGLGDLSNILDSRSYEQAKLILSHLGEDLQRLVVTDAHRRSVQAISDHNFVLLLGAPAAGKSTIGASLAVGAADIWGSMTIRAASPKDLEDHINPLERQFFWIDDAWGATQYQRHLIDAWNRVLPLIRAATQNGSQFLLTSRDYIWKSAQRDLKSHELAALQKSKVIIDVQQLTPLERAQILYNHIKMGDQDKKFKRKIKGHLPAIVESNDFLPETARRLGTKFFTADLKLVRKDIVRFSERPERFLLDTMRSLSPECLAAIAVVFLHGGRARSPLVDGGQLQLSSQLFGASLAHIREALISLNGSLLLLVRDRTGQYWTYKHPTIGDAFATLMAEDSELVEVYLRGAKPAAILNEVVCGDVQLAGAPVCVPFELYDLLVERISEESAYSLRRFLSYRADRELADALLAAKPDLVEDLPTFFSPICDDPDTAFLISLHHMDLLPNHMRIKFLECVRSSALDDADGSFLWDADLRSMFSRKEIEGMLVDVEPKVLEFMSDHIQRLRDEWSIEHDPEEYFSSFERSIDAFVTELHFIVDYREAHNGFKRRLENTIEEMMLECREPEKNDLPSSAHEEAESSLVKIFRDVDE